jgi:hypothetical protein
MKLVKNSRDNKDMFGILLSKSDYMDFLRHPALLWLKKHNPKKIPNLDVAIMQRMASGYAFEEYAERLFPEAIKIGFNSSEDYRPMLEQTALAWKNGANCVAQGMYKSGELTCITDVLEATGDGFTLTEIKSSNSAKPEHVTDLAFQRLVLEASGYEIQKCQVMHANPDYERAGDIDPKVLTKITDVTDQVEKILSKTKENAASAVRVINLDSIPDVDPLLAAPSAFSDWLEIRKILEPKLSDNSIYNLPKIGHRVAKNLIAQNIETIDQIQDATLLSHGTAKYWKAHSFGKQHIDIAELSQFLGSIQYPVYYLDYETAASAVPLWDKTSPHQQVPFQYSLHIKRSPQSKAEHFDYLHQDKDCPINGLLETLIKKIQTEGTVLVWNQSFEKKCNDEMALYSSEYSSFLSSVNNRVIDLMDPFREDIIMNPAFLGSNSIKDVLPVMIPEFSYEDLEIKDGGSAASEWQRVTLNDAADTARVYAELKKYCERDTKAMVLIHEALLEHLTENV